MFKWLSPSHGFAQQFEPDGPNYLYRKNMTGAPIRVTAAEYEAFARGYKRSCMRLLMAAALFPIFHIGTGIFAIITLEIPVAAWYVFGGMLALVAGITIQWFRMINAPAIALKGRAAIGPRRDIASVRHEMFARMSWKEVGARIGFSFLVVLAIGAWAVSRDPPVNWIGFAIFGVGLAGIPFLVLTKIRASR